MNKFRNIKNKYNNNIKKKKKNKSFVKLKNNSISRKKIFKISDFAKGKFFYFFMLINITMFLVYNAFLNSFIEKAFLLDYKLFDPKLFLKNQFYSIRMNFQLASIIFLAFIMFILYIINIKFIFIFIKVFFTINFLFFLYLNSFIFRAILETVEKITPSTFLSIFNEKIINNLVALLKKSNLIRDCSFIIGRKFSDKIKQSSNTNISSDSLRLFFGFFIISLVASHINHIGSLFMNLFYNLIQDFNVKKKDKNINLLEKLFFRKMLAIIPFVLMFFFASSLRIVESADMLSRKGIKEILKGFISFVIFIFVLLSFNYIFKLYHFVNFIKKKIKKKTYVLYFSENYKKIFSQLILFLFFILVNVGLFDSIFRNPLAAQMVFYKKINSLFNNKIISSETLVMSKFSKKEALTMREIITMSKIIIKTHLCIIILEAIFYLIYYQLKIFNIYLYIFFQLFIYLFALFSPKNFCKNIILIRIIFTFLKNFLMSKFFFLLTILFKNINRNNKTTKHFISKNNKKKKLILLSDYSKYQYILFILKIIIISSFSKSAYYIERYFELGNYNSEVEEHLKVLLKQSNLFFFILYNLIIFIFYLILNPFKKNKINKIL